MLSITKNIPSEKLKLLIRHPLSKDSLNIIKGYFKHKLKNIKLQLNKSFKKSYSQYGEDVLIDKILKKKKNGFYVDIGANDPISTNNTKFFYDRGWNGINIEPDPGLFSKLEKHRKRDINLNIGIALKEDHLNFYVSTANTLSTFNEENTKQFKHHKAKLKEIKKLPVMPLEKVFNNYVKSKNIDFMSVDVEGLDLEVLKSNNWKIYRPYLVVVEVNTDKEYIDDFMKSVNYKIEYSNGTNSFYINELIKD